MCTRKTTVVLCRVTRPETANQSRLTASSRRCTSLVRNRNPLSPIAFVVYRLLQREHVLVFADSDEQIGEYYVFWVPENDKYTVYNIIIITNNAVTQHKQKLLINTSRVSSDKYNNNIIRPSLVGWLWVVMYMCRRPYYGQLVFLQKY